MPTYNYLGLILTSHFLMPQNTTLLLTARDSGSPAGEAWNRLITAESPERLRIWDIRVTQNCLTSQ